MKTYLSYFINDDTPIYGGKKTTSIEESSSIARGDSSNTKILKFSNHTGTHIDFPNHFIEKGKTINSYNPDFWHFNHIYVLDYDAKDNEIINEKILSVKIPSNTDFLILNTGFWKKRNLKEYWNNNPGLSPDFSNKLKKLCPNIKIIGFDFISLTSYQDRPLGRIAHKEFLGKNSILIIEDMKLDEIKKNKIKSINAYPLLIDNADGVPITIIAEYE